MKCITSLMLFSMCTLYAGVYVKNETTKNVTVQLHTSINSDNVSNVPLSQRIRIPPRAISRLYGLHMMMHSGSVMPDISYTLALSKVPDTVLPVKRTLRHVYDTAVPFEANFSNDDLRRHPQFRGNASDGGGSDDTDIEDLCGLHTVTHLQYVTKTICGSELQSALQDQQDRYVVIQEYRNNVNDLASRFGHIITSSVPVGHMYSNSSL